MNMIVDEANMEQHDNIDFTIIAAFTKPPEAIRDITDYCTGSIRLYSTYGKAMEASLSHTNGTNA